MVGHPKVMALRKTSHTRVQQAQTEALGFQTLDSVWGGVAWAIAPTIRTLSIQVIVIFAPRRSQMTRISDTECKRENSENSHACNRKKNGQDHNSYFGATV